MSDVTTSTAAEADAKATPKPKEFGFSALVTGLARMWRGTGAALTVIVLNAIVQSVTTWLDAPIGLNITFILSLLASAVSLLLAGAILTQVGLRAVTGKVGLGAAWGHAKAHFGFFVAWTVIWIVILVLIAMVIGDLWILVALVTIYVPIAAADGANNPLSANFSAIKDRLGHWLMTAIVLFIIGFVVFLLTAVNVFFIKGMMASLIEWLVIGIGGWWLMTAWSAIYRSTRVGAATDIETASQNN